VEPQQKGSHHKINFYRRLHAIAYRATLDVPRELLQFAVDIHGEIVNVTVNGVHIRR